jgi:peptide/nickel transport system substrate-binding protein
MKNIKTVAMLFFAGLFVLVGGLPGTTIAASKHLAFTIDAPPYRQLEAQAIASQLRKIGIQAQARVWEKVVLRNEIKKGDRSAYLTDWGSAYFDPFDLAEPKLTTGGRGNFSFYSNPKVDTDLRFGSSSTDVQARKKAYDEVQRAIYHDAPWVFGYVLRNIEAASANVQGYAPSMDNRINLCDVGIKGSDTIVVGMNVNAFVTLDPAMHRSRDTETVIRNMFDALVTRTRGSKVVPEMAKSWKEVNDRTFIFTLRPGITFQNGDPVTADDVVFTFERVLTPGAIGGESSPRKGLLGPLARVEKVSADTVRFVLDKPFPPLLQALVHFQVVPKQYIERVGEDTFAKKPIGAGPFKFVRGSLDSEVVMERYDGYYGGSPDLPPVGPALVKHVIFRTMPEPSTRVAALLAGEVQIIQAVPADLVKRLSKSSRVRVYSVQGTRSYEIELNNKKPPFNDVRVRQAINYAIDWQSILKDIYGGYGTRLSTCFLPSGFGYDAALKPYPYNPEKAKALLRQAGYITK